MILLVQLRTCRRRRGVGCHDDSPDHQGEAADPYEAHHDWFPPEPTAGVLIGHSIPAWGGRELFPALEEPQTRRSLVLTSPGGKWEASWHRLHCCLTGLEDRTSPPPYPGPSPELTSMLSLSLSLSCLPTLPTLTTVHCPVHFLHMLCWPRNILLDHNYIMAATSSSIECSDIFYWNIDPKFPLHVAKLI